MRAKGFRYKKAVIIAVALLLLVLVLFYILRYTASLYDYNMNIENADRSVITVGLLFSKSGSSSQVEKSMINAAQMAFDEINDTGGINGVKIRYILEDYSSTPELAGNKIEKLITKDLAVATIGCYSSSSRQATIPVLEKYDSLLIYPTYTEGEEANNHIIYTGAMPNQQSIQYISRLMEQCGSNVYLLGNDYVFSITCNKQAKHVIDSKKGKIVGEAYVKTGSIEFDDVIKDIKNTNPDFIYCDLVGDSLVAFFESYQKSGLSPDLCPIASITMDEMTLSEIGADCADGHYASMNYFSSLDTQASREFVKKYNDYVSDNSMVTSLAESTYDSCYFLAEALKKVDDPYDTESLIQAFSGLELDAPQGHICIDKTNHCTWLYSRFAVIHDGKFNIIFQSENAIKPEIWFTS